MPMDRVIYERRKALGLTQEQVANRLGVSAPAVNKWERGNTYPDVTLLPALARLLDTDLNTLMCFERELSDREINEICTQIVDAAQKEGLQAGAVLAEEKIREYPNCAGLIYMAAVTLQGSLIFSGPGEKERAEYDAMICQWYERAVECGRDTVVRNRAAYMLAGKYLSSHELEKAERMLELLPDETTDKRALKARLLEQQGKREDAALLLERWIQENLTEMQTALLKLMTIADDEGENERAVQIAEIGSKTAKLYGMWGYSPVLFHLELAIKKKDVEKSLEYIEEVLAQTAASPMELPEAPLLAHVRAYAKKTAAQKDDTEQQTDKKEKEKKYRRNMLASLIREMRAESEEYAFLREDERFIRLLERYEETFIL